MASIFSRFRVTLAHYFGWFRSTSNTVVNVVLVDTSVDSDHEVSASRNIQRSIRFNCADTTLKLRAEELGQLTEESVAAVLDAHTSCTTVTQIVVTQHFLLSNIPSSIGKFVNLTSVDLASNSLQDLPWSLVYLRHLKILNLSNNRFCSIPPIIGHLTTLEELILKDNDLRSLPTSLVHLKVLKVLQLSGNANMKSPPVDICRKGAGVILMFLERRLGRSNLWRNYKQHYTEDTGCTQGDFQMKSLLEICVATVLKLKLDYFSWVYLPPPLKRHLHDRSLAEMKAVNLSKCSRCKGYYSTWANFDGHDCT